MEPVIFRFTESDTEHCATPPPPGRPLLKKAEVEILHGGCARFLLINGQPIGGVLDLEMPGDRPGPQVKITLLADKVTMRQATREECEALAVGDRGPEPERGQP